MIREVPDQDLTKQHRKALLSDREYTMERLTEILNYIKEMDILDILDIGLVAFILYALYKFIRERRATKLAVGVIILFALNLFSDFLNLTVMQFILQNVLQVGMIALVIVFQPELRSALEKVGSEPIRSFRNLADSKASYAEYNDAISNICDAACNMALDRTGALIVIERTTDLTPYAESGTELDAKVNSYLLKNIFFNKAPMHDGAVILRDSRVRAAGCFLPLSTNPDIVKDLGTRHRAAIGLSEVSDAVVIVVSEETGVISVAQEGKLRRGYDHISLSKALRDVMLAQSSENTKNPVKAFFSRIAGQFNKKHDEKGEGEQ